MKAIIIDHAKSGWADDARKHNTGLALYDSDDIAAIRSALAAGDGARIVIERSNCSSDRFIEEKSISEDTTASGGNASLLAAVA